MADKKTKYLKMNAPLAAFKYPKLVEPDYGSKDYPNPEGVYTTKLVWDENDPKFVAFRAKMEPFLAAVEKMADVEFAKLKKPQRDKLGSPTCNDMFVPLYNEDDTPTGQVEAKVSMKASGVVKQGTRAGKKWARKPNLFDALGRPIKGDIEIWGGTEGIVNFSFNPAGYFIPATGAFGIKMQLEAVQVVTLRAGGEASAESYGFGAQEGGFDASQYDAPEKDGDMDDDEDSTGGDNHLPEGDPEGATDF